MQADPIPPLVLEEDELELELLLDELELLELEEDELLLELLEEELLLELLEEELEDELLLELLEEEELELPEPLGIEHSFTPPGTLVPAPKVTSPQTKLPLSTLKVN